MLRFILRRLAIIPLALLLVNFIGFAYAYLVKPIMASRNPYSALLSNAVPLAPTYLAYLGRVFCLDFGILPNNQPVAEAVGNATLASLGLVVLASSLSIVVGLLIGLRAVHSEPARVSFWLPLVCTVGLASPSFYVAVLLITASVIYLLWGPTQQALLPFQGFGWDAHLALPTVALMVQPTVRIARVTAGLLAGELNKQYVVTARSLGHTWRAVLRRHALRNILASVLITISGSLRLLIAELIIVERLFGWPGLGRMLSNVLVSPLTSLNPFAPSNPLYLDPPLLAAVMTVLAALFLMVDLVVSILVRQIDPRLRE